MEKVYLTKEGYRKLEEELTYLKNVKRKEITKALEHARLLGDLRENAEYTTAKEALAFNEKRVQDIEDKLSRAEIIDTLRTSVDRVCVGTKVTLLDTGSNEELMYSLVGSDEANPAEGLISITSPVGKALLGHKEGEVVEIEIPAGVLTYKIVKLSR
jgi:transcription elongation factor GreA